ncbi:hypothetical protein KFK09_020267 [Dendrobium nobile]|uniref:Uncharacterized protein n=1 Tax=Dendrobium nobile TaxID=94219 RepID=A0A8T3ATI6_DENNO|nr:hypothetical protein KFK09_020267 [Dendrobium nobile]
MAWGRRERGKRHGEKEKRTYVTFFVFSLSTGKNRFRCFAFVSSLLLNCSSPLIDFLCNSPCEILFMLSLSPSNLSAPSPAASRRKTIS